MNHRTAIKIATGLLVAIATSTVAFAPTTSAGFTSDDKGKVSITTVNDWPETELVIEPEENTPFNPDELSEQEGGVQ